jgi:hypothetical protein
MKDPSKVFGRDLASIKRDLGVLETPEPFKEEDDLVARLYKALEASGDPILESLTNKLGGYLASGERCVVTLKIDPIKGLINITY